MASSGVSQKAAWVEAGKDGVRVADKGRGKATDDEDVTKKEVLERVLDGVDVKKVRHPHAVRYIEKKLVDKGVHRMERYPADGLSLQAHAPPKSGHGGKYTWQGPEDTTESELDPVPPAIDERDPNYVDYEEEEKAEREAAGEEGGDGNGPVVGEVEVAKVAEAKGGVSRIEVQPPLQSAVDDN